MMPPMQPGNSTDPSGGAFQKLADQAAQALAGMYKLVHKQAPDSPEGEALVTLQKAVAEIEARFESGQTASPDPAAADPSMDPTQDPAVATEQDPSVDPTQEVPAAEPSGRPMFDAASALHAETQADARKRKGAA